MSIVSIQGNVLKEVGVVFLSMASNAYQLDVLGLWQVKPRSCNVSTTVELPSCM